MCCCVCFIQAQPTAPLQVKNSRPTDMDGVVADEQHGTFGRDRLLARGTLTFRRFIAPPSTMNSKQSQRYIQHSRVCSVRYSRGSSDGKYPRYLPYRGSRYASVIFQYITETPGRFGNISIHYRNSGYASVIIQYTTEILGNLR
ncbi:unnamed protein product [Ectocarpus sp. 4 AP-2014]